MFPDTEKFEWISMQFTCPRCRRIFFEKIWLPPAIIDPGGRQMTALCNDCAEKHRTETRAEQEEFNLKTRIARSQIPVEFQTFDQKRGNLPLARWINRNRDSNLLVIGDFETGKTRAAACVLMSEARAGKSCRFFDFPELSKHYSRLLQESMLSAIEFQIRLLSFDRILIDDIAKRRINETAGELLYDLINKIYEGANAKIWLTSNYDTRHLVAKFENHDLGGAVLSRIDRMVDDGKFKIWREEAGK